MTAHSQSVGWRGPVFLGQLSDGEVATLVRERGLRGVIDPIDSIAEEVFELRQPHLRDDSAARARFIREVSESRASFGEWVLFPWDQMLVRFPDPDTLYELRTFRNRNLVTASEQSLLRDTRIAILGLSVGSNVADSLVQLGVGSELMLFDHDRLGITNLNRLRASMLDVGLLKTEIQGRKVARLDPFVTQLHFPGGYDGQSDEVLRRMRPDVIVEEVDDIVVKAKIRRLAQELRVPLVMAGDVGDRSTLEIERHDLAKVKPFNGKISTRQFEAMLSGTSSDTDGALIRMLGLRNVLSPRLLESAMKRASELGGLPQLGTTAAVGGALAALAVREILLGRIRGSSSRVVDLRKVVGARPPTTLKQSLGILRAFAQYRGTAAS